MAISKADGRRSCNEIDKAEITKHVNKIIRSSKQEMCEQKQTSNYSFLIVNISSIKYVYFHYFCRVFFKHYTTDEWNQMRKMKMMPSLWKLCDKEKMRN